MLKLKAILCTVLRYGAIIQCFVIIYWAIHKFLNAGNFECHGFTGTNLTVNSELCSTSLSSTGFKVNEHTIYFVVTVSPANDASADFTRLAQSLASIPNIVVVLVEASSFPMCRRAKVFERILKRNKLPWTYIHANILHKHGKNVYNCIDQKSELVAQDISGKWLRSSLKVGVVYFGRTTAVYEPGKKFFEAIRYTEVASVFPVSHLSEPSFGVFAPIVTAQEGVQEVIGFLDPFEGSVRSHSLELASVAFNVLYLKELLGTFTLRDIPLSSLTPVLKDRTTVYVTHRSNHIRRIPVPRVRATQERYVDTSLPSLLTNMDALGMLVHYPQNGFELKSCIGEECGRLKRGCC